MKILKAKMPAFLASALINGDTSGLEENELHWVDKALEYCDPGNIVDVSEPYFSWSCELPGWTLGGDMADYTILYND